MLITAVVLLIVAAVAVIAFRSYRRTLAQGCCGAGGGTMEVQEEEKKLDGPVIAQKTVLIEGMTCVNCQNRIQRRLNRIEGISASVDYKTGKAVLKMDREIPDNTVRTAIAQMDYRVVSIE